MKRESKYMILMLVLFIIVISLLLLNVYLEVNYGEVFELIFLMGFFAVFFFIVAYRNFVVSIMQFDIKRFRISLNIVYFIGIFGPMIIAVILLRALNITLNSYSVLTTTSLLYLALTYIILKMEKKKMKDIFQFKQ